MNGPGSAQPDPTAREPLHTSLPSAPSDYPGPVILIGDPDPDSRVIFSTMLRYRGFRPVAVHDGEEALHAAREFGPGLAVLDIRLGWQVLEAFRADPEAGRIPLAVLSSVDLGPERERARALGCARFLAKPISPSELVREIRDLLRPVI